MILEINDILEALNIDRKNRYLRPFERMALHKEISNQINAKSSVLCFHLIDKVRHQMSEERINKRYKRR